MSRLDINLRTLLSGRAITTLAALPNSLKSPQDPRILDSEPKNGTEPWLIKRTNRVSIGLPEWAEQLTVRLSPS